jgi:hypothetical protein
MIIIVLAAAGCSTPVPEILMLRHLLPQPSRSASGTSTLSTSIPPTVRYAATHHGVFRLAPEGAVQAGLAHDMMGFAITGPDRFISSGHERA